MPSIKKAMRRFEGPDERHVSPSRLCRCRLLGMARNSRCSRHRPSPAGKRREVDIIFSAAEKCRLIYWLRRLYEIHFLDSKYKRASKYSAITVVNVNAVSVVRRRHIGHLMWLARK